MISSDLIDSIIISSAAVSTTIVGIIVGLLKFKIIYFGKGAEKKVNETKPCPLHKNVDEVLASLREKQQLNLLRHAQHEHQLEVGEVKFKELQEEVGDLKEGVGILMDRSGGRPADWQRRKR